MDASTRELRLHLHREFDRRKARNRRYSLRAYARDLHLSPSQLSEFLSEKKSVSPARRELLWKKLGLSSHLQWSQNFLAEEDIVSSLAKVGEDIKAWAGNKAVAVELNAFHLSKSEHNEFKYEDLVHDTRPLTLK